MHGNVWEWCLDGWNPSAYQAIRDEIAVDPLTPWNLGSNRVVGRGAHFYYGPGNGRSARRGNAPQTLRYLDNGFRAALSVEAVKFALENPVQAEAPLVEKNAKELLILKGHMGAVTSVAFSPDGKRLASASGDARNGEVKVWDATTGHETLTLKGHTSQVKSVAFSPDGKRLASASGDSTVKLWDAISGQETLTLKGNQLPIDSVAFCLDGKRLASSTNDGTVKVWDAASGQELLTLMTGHSATLLSMAFSQDGKRLATSSLDKTVKVWDATNGQELLTLNGQTNGVISLAFSPDGKRLASASADRTLKVWDVTSGQETLKLKGHTGAIRSVAYSADGKWLASASSDQTAKVWDATSGQETLTLKGHTGYVLSVAFSPDGKRLASASLDGTVKVWDVTPRHEDDKDRKNAAQDWKVWPKDSPPPAIAPFDAAQAKQHQEAWAKHLGVPVEYTNSIGMKFRLIPPGEFLMGATSKVIEGMITESTSAEYQAKLRSQTPQHKVILTQPIYLGVHEVTQGNYETVTGNKPSHFAATGTGREAVKDLETTRHPVDSVSWNDVAEFCAKLSEREKLSPFNFMSGAAARSANAGYRLPTEAEWERACRA
ncbi:MAG: hypothetical protein FD138_4104, partial [Planctomycetota bacterium]